MIDESLISKSLAKDLTDLRESLHQYPELSNQEFQTQKRLLEALEKCNVSDIQTPGTSIVARIKGVDSSRPPVAIRGDIDALPITEKTGVPFASKHDGVMHACGHDVHATWALGAARLLSDSPCDSDVILILQQAEEMATGAQFLLDSGAIPSNICAIFGAHVDRRYDVGKVVCHTGAISSYSDKNFIAVKGVSAHAARPKEGLNPIPVLGELTRAISEVMTTIGDDTNLITVTQVSGGSAHNIIPEKVELSGTIRCLSNEKRKLFHKALTALKTLPSDCMIDVKIQSASPAVINHLDLEQVAKVAITESISKDAAVPLISPNMASEDFGFYAQEFPGWFYRIGARPVGEAFIPVHTPEFIADTECICWRTSLATTARLAAKLNQSTK